MDIKEVREWESALDNVEQTGTMIVALPRLANVGERFIDKDMRWWIYVRIVSGNVGGRWAYWAPIKGKLDNKHPEYLVVADKLFNGDSPHFAGMLARPYPGRVVGVDAYEWVLQRGGGVKMAASTETIVEEPQKVRYEKSKDVYDVETGTSKELP